MVDTKAIRKKMIDNDISQRELAKIMKRSPTTINQWVNGKKNLTVSDIDALCIALNITCPTEKALIFLSSPS